MNNGKSLSDFTQVFGPFLPLRAADQIHADIAYNDVTVRLIDLSVKIQLK